MWSSNNIEPNWEKEPFKNSSMTQELFQKILRSDPNHNFDFLSKKRTSHNRFWRRTPAKITQWKTNSFWLPNRILQNWMREFGARITKKKKKPKKTPLKKWRKNMRKTRVYLWVKNSFYTCKRSFNFPPTIEIKTPSHSKKTTVSQTCVPYFTWSSLTTFACFNYVAILYRR